MALGERGQLFLMGLGETARTTVERPKLRGVL